ncbi:MAG: hypothetical protein H6988_12520 [Pseudomonadales bacterium]|nr:hypothetical protein [Pseudomonadales bacterium]
MIETLRLLELTEAAFRDAVLANEPLAEALAASSRRLEDAVRYDPQGAIRVRNFLLSQAEKAEPGIAAEEARLKAQLIDLARSGGLH